MFYNEIERLYDYLTNKLYDKLENEYDKKALYEFLKENILINLEIDNGLLYLKLDTYLSEKMAIDFFFEMGEHSTSTLRELCEKMFSTRKWEQEQEIIDVFECKAQENEILGENYGNKCL